MCNRYTSPEIREVEAFWHIGRSNSVPWARTLVPRAMGPFLRAWDGPGVDLVTGQWGMIPRDSLDRTPRKKPLPGKKQGAPLSTNNARAEGLDKTWTYRFAWSEGKRCLIPALWFVEPNWESLKNEWWQFRRADGRPWALAGIWNEWTDPASGEVVPNYSMITINANAHPLMSRMHKPEVDPVTKQTLPLAQQDKRSVVSIESTDFDQWLHGTVEQARALLRLSPVETFDARPEPVQPKPEPNQVYEDLFSSPPKEPD